MKKIQIISYNNIKGTSKKEMKTLFILFMAEIQRTGEIVKLNLKGWILKC